MENEKTYQIMKRSSDLAVKVFGKTQAEVLANSAFLYQIGDV